MINLIDCWLERNIDMFPSEEKENIKQLLEDRKAGLNISHHKPQ